MDVNLKSPPVVSLREGMQLTPDELLHELRRVRVQLLDTYIQDPMLPLAVLNPTALSSVPRSVISDMILITLPNHILVLGDQQKPRGGFLPQRKLYASFDERDAAQVEREYAATEKAKQKAVQSAAETQQIANDAASRNFSGRISSYKKPELISCSLIS